MLYENLIFVRSELAYENGHRVLYVVLEKGETDLSKYMRNIATEHKLFYISICWRQMLIAVSKIHDEGKKNFF